MTSLWHHQPSIESACETELITVREDRDPRCLTSVTSEPPGPPSAPRSIVSNINDTSVTLEWREPLDRGGRGDLTYRVLCFLCGTTTKVDQLDQLDQTHSDQSDQLDQSDQTLSESWLSFLSPLQGSVSACPPCDDSVVYQPAQRGLTQGRVIVWGLRPHTKYTFTIQSVNGVSSLSQSEPASSSVNVTTSRDGTEHDKHPQCIS